MKEREKKRNSEINISSATILLICLREVRDIEYSYKYYIIYVNKTAIQIRTLFDLLTWVACGTFFVGRERRKKWKNRERKNG